MKNKKIRKTYSEKMPEISIPLPDISDKKEKAKISAQNTRKRRKAYIQKLEQQVENLQQQLKKYQVAPQQSMFAQFLAERKYLFDKLEQAFKDNQQMDIKIMVDTLRFNYGIAGVGRMKAIDHYCNQLIDSLLPMHMRYLFWVAAENCDVFQNNMIQHEYSFDNQDSQVNCFKSFGLDEEQTIKIQQLQQKIQFQRQAYDDLIVEIFKINNKIKKEGEQCQAIVDEIRQILTIEQSAEFLITLDKTRLEQLKAKKVYPDSKSQKGRFNIRQLLQYETLKQLFSR
ncbi:hypothetical protein pb186bvf_005507 [Paramecium bursaria]